MSDDLDIKKFLANLSEDKADSTTFRHDSIWKTRTSTKAKPLLTLIQLKPKQRLAIKRFLHCLSRNLSPHFYLSKLSLRIVEGIGYFLLTNIHFKKSYSLTSLLS